MERNGAVTEPWLQAYPSIINLKMRVFFIISITLFNSVISQAKNIFNNIQKLSITEQKKVINFGLTKFYSVCQNDSRIAKTDSLNGQLVTYYEPIWESDYDTCFSPILEYFPTYYKKTKDTVTLLNFFKAVNCNTDGEFGEGFHSVLQACYFQNKQLFVRQVKKIRNRVTRNFIIQGLLTGIQAGYMVDINNRQSIIDKEKKIALMMLKK